jgi:hypothetical protein
MKVTYFRFSFNDNLTVQMCPYKNGSMGGRMYRANIDHHNFANVFKRFDR